MHAPATANTQDLLSKAELLAHILRGLEPYFPPHSLLYQTEDTTPYECDGLTAYLSLIHI